MDPIALIVIVVIVLILIIFIGYFIIVYNALIRLKNNIKKAWADIDVLLKQRSDELPKLIGAVKGYMKHERELLTKITEARSALLKSKSKSDMAAADNMMSQALKSLFAVAENYPNLKANENFMQLQARISAIENELSDRRELYNDSVNTYNIKTHSFPDMFVARMLKYKDEEMFKASSQERKDVKVEL